MRNVLGALVGAAALLVSGSSIAETTLTIATVNNGDMIRMQGLTGDFTAKHPDSYLFYDGVHPGTRAQQALGLVAAADVFAAGIVHRPHDHEEDARGLVGALEHLTARLKLGLPSRGT